MEQLFYRGVMVKFRVSFALCVKGVMVEHNVTCGKRRAINHGNHTVKHDL